MYPPQRHTFVAILVFDYGSGRRGIEPFVLSATHPEVAYQRALAKGSEKRPGRTFAGLADLRVTMEDIPRIAKIEGGVAEELVVTKDQLTAFADESWTEVPCDAAELAAALAEPPSLVELSRVH